MQTRSDFPRLGTVRQYPRRNQWGRRSRREPVMPCACCDAFASNHVVVQTSHFRSEDLNLFLCDAHADYARRDEWRVLFDAMKRAA